MSDLEVAQKDVMLKIYILPINESFAALEKFCSASQRLLCNAICHCEGGREVGCRGGGGVGLREERGEWVGEKNVDFS